MTGGARSSSLARLRERGNRIALPPGSVIPAAAKRELGVEPEPRGPGSMDVRLSKARERTKSLEPLGSGPPLRPE